MPRALRKKSESGIYHIMLRGIDRQVIFQDDEDREKYLQCLEAAKRASGFTLHARHTGTVLLCDLQRLAKTQ